MSLKYQIMIAAVLLFSSLALIKGQDDPDDIGDWNPNWNYTQGGDDWNFTNCNKLTQQQSPVDLLNPGKDWWIPDKAVPFTFLPSYKAGVPTITKDVNFTYIAHGDFGSIIITEPSDYGATQVIKWNSKYVKFHYPSEHTYNGTRFDVEMQIYHDVSHLA